MIADVSRGTIRAHNNVDRKLQEIINKLKHSTINTTALRAKLEAANLAPQKPRTHSDPICQETAPHPAKRSRTHVVPDITTWTEDAQAQRQRKLQSACARHPELLKRTTQGEQNRMDFVLTDRVNKLIYGMVPKVEIEYLPLLSHMSTSGVAPLHKENL